MINLAFCRFVRAGGRDFVAHAALTIFLIVCGAIAFGQSSSAAQPIDPLDYVDPFIGSAGGGNVFVGATLPFGFIQAGPDTLTNSGASGYKHSKPINGFSQQHVSGLGGPIYGEFSLMPITGEVTNPSVVVSSGKTWEAASPGYYTVTLAPWNVKVELTCTRHVAFHRDTFPADSQARILLDVGHCLYGASSSWNSARPVGGEVNVDSDRREVSGYMVYRGGRSTAEPWKAYFVARFDAPVSAYSTWSDDLKMSDSITFAKGSKIGACLNFSTKGGQVVQSKVAVSWRSIEQARTRLDQELSGWDFEAVRTTARAEWKQALGRIEIEGGSAVDLRRFYTALYHMHLAPNDWTGEAPERYGGLTYYENQLCLWDIFRTVTPMFTLIQPKVSADIVNSLINFSTIDGWTGDAHSAHQYEHVQNGSSADNVIADAYVKNLPGIDWSKAYQAIRKNAFEDASPKTNRRPKKGRFHLNDYRHYGYLPTDTAANKDIQAVSRTLEYVYNDFCVLTLARKFGSAEEVKDLESRLLWYKNVWDAGVGGFMRGKTAAGKWYEPFDPVRDNQTGKQYYEGHAWTWSWFVPHDVQGLINLNGGDESFIAKLTTSCEKYYEADNEPCMLESSLFIHAGRPDLTERFSREALKNFDITDKGLPGNDDSGTTSAWLVWTMLGIFPNAGQDLYYIGSPVFPKVTIHLGNGKKFLINAPAATAEKGYISAAKLNDQPWNQAWFRHGDLIGGGTLELGMTATPSKWGCSVRPPSVSVPAAASINKPASQETLVH